MTVSPVYTPVTDARGFALKRPRAVPPEVFAEKHFGFRDSIPRVMKKYGDKVETRIFTNEKVEGKPFTGGSEATHLKKLADKPAFVDNFRSNTVDEILQKVRNVDESVLRAAGAPDISGVSKKGNSGKQQGLGGKNEQLDVTPKKGVRSQSEIEPRKKSQKAHPQNQEISGQRQKTQGSTKESSPTKSQTKPDFETFVGKKLFPIIGAASIVIAIGFFAVWAFANGWVSPMGRVAIGIAVSLALMGLGEYLKDKYSDYFTTLVSAGLAGLIITTLVAHYAYDFISSTQALMALALWKSLMNGPAARG